MYRINPFLIHQLNKEEYVVQTKSSTVLITSEELIRILRDIENENLSELTTEWLNDKTNLLNSSEVITFLLDNNMIKKVASDICETKRIICCTNNYMFSDIFKKVFESKYEIVIITIDEIFDYMFYDTDICILFLNPFLYREFLKIDLHLKTKNVLNKFIIYYNHSIYISNFFKSDWNIPCPKCFFSNLENHLRGNQVTEKVNFQLLIDLIYEKKVNFPICTNTEYYDLISTIYILQHQFLALYNKENYILSELTEISLVNNSITKDSAVYWEICDCYE